MADVALGSGLFSSKQVREAASMAADAAIRYPEYSMSFTGHSLGGGLASLMAVFFNKPAVAFAEAPFEPAAFNTGNLSYVAESLANTKNNDTGATATGLIANFAAYRQSPASTLSARENQVENYAAKGEFLTNAPFIARSASNTIYGDNKNHTIDIWSTENTMDGGEGNDLLVGSSDADVMVGSDGDDVIYGQAANNSDYWMVA